VSSPRLDARRPVQRREPAVVAFLAAWCALAGVAWQSGCGSGGNAAGASGVSGGGRGGSGGSTASTGASSSTGSSTATGHGGSGSGGTDGGQPPAVVSVLTNHNDNAHTGANLAETKLTTANVDVGHFGMIFARSVDDQIYAQPLILPGVTIPGKGAHNVVYVATMNDSVYAFDADDPAANAPLWQVSFIDPANGVVPVDHTDVGQSCGNYQDISGNIGILTTPVIDAGTGTIYLVAKTKETAAGQVYRLHALDVTTGAERAGSPVVISATVPGTGDGSQGGMVAFNPVTANQRSALTLAIGTVYIAFSSYCDTPPYHGWVLGYDAQTLAQKAVYNDTPNGGQGGIWMSGQGVSVDEAGNVYFVSGNGTFDGNVDGGADFGSAYLKLSPSLTVLDWFAPFNFADLNAADLDLGCSGALLVPGTNLSVNGGKDGNLYVLDRTHPGHWNAADNSQIVQSIQATDAHIHGAPIVWPLASGPLIYVWGEYGYLNSYLLTGGQFSHVGQSTVPVPNGMPGAMLALSANGTTAGSAIVWASHPLTGDANQAVRPGILEAFDADDLTHELWDTQQNAGRDDFGNFAKFCPPTVANGKVYLATFSKQLVVYGPLSSPGPCQNGKQDPDETGVDCGGTCAPCAPRVFTCQVGGAMAVGDSFTCDLGSTRTVTAVSLSVGCNDGETGTFSLTFDQPPVLDPSAACNSSFMVGPMPSRHVTVTMLSGGGADQNISVQSVTVTHD
jgi:hypothetical protein